MRFDPFPTPNPLFWFSLAGPGAANTSRHRHIALILLVFFYASYFFSLFFSHLHTLFYPAQVASSLYFCGLR